MSHDTAIIGSVHGFSQNRPDVTGTATAKCTCMKCLVAVAASFLRRFDGAVDRKEAIGCDMPVGDGAVMRCCFALGYLHCRGFVDSTGLSAGSFAGGAWSE